MGRKRVSQLVTVEPKAILARYAEGEKMSEIAPSLGLKGAEQIYRKLLRECPEEWKEHQAARAIRILEEARDEMELAQDALSLARARERVRSAQWELERTCRRIYGQDVPQSVAAVQVNINLRREKQLDVVASQEDAPSEPL